MLNQIDLAKENRLLQRCSVINKNDASCGLLWQSIHNNLDWGYIVKNALENGTSSLLYRNLKKSNEVTPIPGWVIERLKNIYFDVTARNIFLLEELGKVLKKFSEENISSVVLKGASILESIYQDIGLRTMDDIDILIRKEQFFSIDKSLRQLGYFSYYNWSDYRDIGKSYYLNSLYYQKRRGSISVFLHLHWHIINTTVPNYPRGSIDIERFWQQARQVPVAGVKSLVMAPHHLLIHLLEHILKHSYSPFILSCDIFKVIDYYSGNGLDWDLLVNETVEFNLTKPVYFSLYFISKLTAEEKIPHSVLARLKPSRLNYGERKLQSIIGKNKPFPELKYFLYFVMNEKLSDKLRFILRIVFPPREVLALQEIIAPEDVRLHHYFLKIKSAFVKGLRILTHLSGYSA